MPHETVKRHMYDAIVAGEKPKPTPALIEAINRGPYRGLFALRDGAWTWGQKVPSALAIVVTREALCVARVDAAGNLSLLQRRVAPLVPRHGRTDSPKGYAKRLSGVFRAMRDSADFESLAPPAGIAVSWPAPIGVDDDALGQGEPLERDRDSAKTWDGVSVRKLIADAAFEQFTVRLPVRLVNDANAELLAEAAHGVATDDESAVLIKLSGGIGGATMLKRYLHAGEGRIGEIGHLPIDERILPKEMITDRPVICSCGANNHLECYACARNWFAQAYKNDRSSSYEHLVRQMNESSPKDYHDLFWNSGKLLGQTLLPVITFLDPAKIVISSICPREPLLDAFKIQLTQPRLPAFGARVVAGTTAQGAPIALLGAAHVARQRFILPHVREWLKLKPLSSDLTIRKVPPPTIT